MDKGFASGSAKGERLKAEERVEFGPMPGDKWEAATVTEDEREPRVRIVFESDGHESHVPRSTLRRPPGGRVVPNDPERERPADPVEGLAKALWAYEGDPDEAWENVDRGPSRDRLRAKARVLLEGADLVGRSQKREAVLDGIFAGSENQKSLASYVPIFDRSDPWWQVWADRILKALEAPGFLAAYEEGRDGLTAEEMVLAAEALEFAKDYAAPGDDRAPTLATKCRALASRNVETGGEGG